MIMFTQSPPQTPEQIDLLYKLGQAEAATWAKEAGFGKKRRPPPPPGVAGAVAYVGDRAWQAAAAAGGAAEALTSGVARAGSSVYSAGSVAGSYVWDSAGSAAAAAAGLVRPVPGQN